MKLKGRKIAIRASPESLHSHGLCQSGPVAAGDTDSSCGELGPGENSFGGRARRHPKNMDETELVPPIVGIGPLADEHLLNAALPFALDGKRAP
jgi:hypothetical protein